MGRSAASEALSGCLYTSPVPPVPSLQHYSTLARILRGFQEFGGRWTVVGLAGEETGAQERQDQGLVSSLTAYREL